jgi:undecaprenol kinase
VKHFIRHQHKRFGYAFTGFRTAYRSDPNFKLQVWSSLVYIVFGYLVWPLSQSEVFFLLISYVLIIITELQNTSLEIALNHMHPERHENIGASKDIAAAAVLIAGLFALIVVLTITLSRIF